MYCDQVPILIYIAQLSASKLGLQSEIQWAALVSGLLHCLPYSIPAVTPSTSSISQMSEYQSILKKNLELEGPFLVLTSSSEKKALHILCLLSFSLLVYASHTLARSPWPYLVRILVLQTSVLYSQDSLCFQLPECYNSTDNSCSGITYLLFTHRDASSISES